MKMLPMYKRTLLCLVGLLVSLMIAGIAEAALLGDWQGPGQRGASDQQSQLAMTAS